MLFEHVYVLNSEMGGHAMKLSERRIVIRGGGDIATGVAWRLHKAGFPVFVLEVARPLAVRRKVCFCEAVWDGTAEVEGVRARRAESPEEAGSVHAGGEVPVLVDPDLEGLPALKADVIVDATLAKKNLGVTMDLAPLVIGLGPGFTAGVDVHKVVETKRGHNLGRVISKGTAVPNTGVPGNIGGYTTERVLRAPADGVFHTSVELGALVVSGQVVAEVEGQAVRAKIEGMVRGLIRPGITVSRGMKVGDVDPRGKDAFLDTISDKALAVAGGVLEAVLHMYNR